MHTLKTLFAEKFVAALAAVLIAGGSFATVVSVPQQASAQVASASAPSLA